MNFGERFFFLCILESVIIMAIALAVFSSRAISSLDEATPLGDYLTFPAGYELFDTYVPSGHFNPVYICRNTDSGDYRICKPVITEGE